MSIVQSAMERIKKESRESEARASAPRVNAPASAAEGGARTRAPAPIQWPVLQPPVQIDIEQLRARKLYPPADFVQRQQDEYRSIRREVIAGTREKIGSGGATVGPIIVVTSALPGDGKSYTALNLAMSIASEGVYDVMLIDGDTVKQTVSTALGVQDRPGLVELLSQPDASFLEYVVPTGGNGRLHVLPSGDRSGAVGDLLSAGHIAPLFDSIRATMSGHFVIVDTPPILLSSETQVFTDAAGQVLLVVRAAHSLQDSVKDAVARIRETIPVGIVLNGWSPILPSEKKAYTAFREYMK